MKKYLILLSFSLLGFFLTSCEDTATGPPEAGTEGSIFIQSTPSGAQIFVGTNSTNLNNTGKVTPDSVLNLSEGQLYVRLVLSGYKDTIFTISVTAGLQTSRLINLNRAPVRIYETSNTSADEPSGLDLSSGMAYAISGNNLDSVDIYYSSTGFVIRSSDDINANNTVFFVGNSSNLDDGVDSPLAQNAGQQGWTDRVIDTQTNYFFLFDSDLHYSKMIITDRGGTGDSDDPKWVEVEWRYNEIVNDQEF